MIAIGSGISHFQILEKLGEGGMGVVWKARDTHLDRMVALKVLPAGKVADPERKRRFVQEAKAASALNHPNIITIHEISCEDGIDFIVMECVPGKALDQLIPRKGLRLGEALKYAVQIADALAQAHAAGIVHRDLKPSNIMVSDDGVVKVLDFGLAKLAEAPDAREDEPTRTIRAETEAGTIVGTTSYMSPEQAEGKKVDSRSDIFAFGAVLYEMVTGRRAFQGDSKMSTLAAILNQEPKALSEVSEGVPRDLEKIITRCLRKDAGRRFQHMDDVKIALEEVKEESESGRLLSPLPVAPPRSRVSAPPIAAAVVLIAATAAATWWLSRPRPADSLTGLARLTSDSGLTWEPALSSDGKLIAYSSDRGATSGAEGNLDIWVQQITGGEPIRLTRDPADDREPAFSPDNSRIAFRSDREGGGIYVVPALGGEERLVAKDGQRPRFSPDGQWIAYWVGNRATGDPTAPGSAQSYVVAATGGTPRRLHPEFSVMRSPIWAPDGKHILFWGKLDAKATGPEGTDWWVVSLEGGAPVKTGAADACRSRHLANFFVPEAWLADGRVVFSARSDESGDLWQLSIATRTWRAAGPPSRLTTGTGMSEQPSIAEGRDAAGNAVTRLAFSGPTRDIQIWGLPFEANRGRVTGALHRLTQGPAAAEFAALSLDGRHLAFARARAGDRDIWIKDLRTGREADLTPAPGSQFHPRITPDGSKVSYSETKDGKSSIYTMSIGSAADGALRPGVPEKLCDTCRWAWQWTWDGTRILFDPGAAGRPYIALANVASGEKSKLISHPQYNLYQANASPDGRWVAFLAHIDSHRGQLFVVPFRPASAPASGGIPSDWIAVTSGAFWDDKPRWSPDGNVLYFISDRDGFLCFWGQRLDPATKRPAGPPFAIYHFHGVSRSMMNVGLGGLETSVARDLVVFNLAEITGNIWIGNLEPAK